MAKNNNKLNDNYVFGLDIGTRSVVGVVGYRTGIHFKVMAYAMVEHDTRAMIDGQIHDIGKATETILQVKKNLEKQLGVTLHKACIAAAGRVLKTALIHVNQEMDPTIIIDDHHINTLELLGMEKALQQVNTNLDEEEMGYHCVGYTVSKYYLNDYEITSLKDHKSKKISADVLATFLPQEVIESLYSVVKNADMEVYSLTLEPIAAIHVAIPEEFRLLNIALVDIGAGTSDIAITKDGGIVAYGMIPMAGDELTEAIVHHYLVDFNTAEKIKIKASTKAKTVTFKDVIGMKHTVDTDEINQILEDDSQQLALKIANRIIELNNGKATNAVFVVGGGGQVKHFTKVLSQSMGLSPDRVAIRGKEVLDVVDFGESKIKKGPELITPIGICLTGLENNKHDFIQVYLNDEPIKIYDNNRLTIMDVVAYKGIEPKKFIAKKGQALEFEVNQNQRRITGEPGIPAKILLNNEEVNLTTKIKMHDYITVIEAKNGKDANLSTYQLVKTLDLKVYFDEKVYPLVPEIYVNEILMTMNHDIKNNDIIRLKLPSLINFLRKHDLDDFQYEYYINGQRSDEKSCLADLDHITRREKKSQNNRENESDEVETTGKCIYVSVNETPIKLEGKSNYVFVDIFDVYPFDLSKPQGNVVCKINKATASYMGEIHDGDHLEVYWEQIS
ncbi:cell division protein FtsA [Petrocella sp. FN5]|uniref:cell division protein FtsA n=1 Tax=Petrocella sp. FN5 TaxID=3032002 RepID=UPI0023DB630D|nr:cell division FtsA domain-containing protein [Petrocella sp. FN5]MDF1618277.1 cell division FtsA domain-containing protein [Petrocella sp. FN5]